MIFISTERNFNYTHAFSEKICYANETIKKIGTITYKNIIEPIAVGASAGVCQFVGSLAIATTLTLAGVSEVLTTEGAAEVYKEFIINNIFAVVVLAPLLEEIIFRVIVQGSFYWIASKILPDMDVKIFSYKVKLAALVSIVAGAALFGIVHLSNGTGLIQVVTAVSGGITLGLLKYHYGLLASTSAHMTINGIVVGALLLAN